MSGDLWRNVGSCQRGRGLEWFRLVSPSPPRIGAQLKDSAVFLIGKAGHSVLMIWQEGIKSIGKVRAFYQFGLSPVDRFLWQMCI